MTIPLTTPPRSEAGRGGLGVYPQDHALHDPNVAVLRPEIRSQGDNAGHWNSTGSPTFKTEMPSDPSISTAGRIWKWARWLAHRQSDDPKPGAGNLAPWAASVSEAQEHSSLLMPGRPQ